MSKARDLADLITTGVLDGRDVGTDGTKLDGIEANADVTDAANVEPLVDAHLNRSTANTGEYLKWNGTDYDWATVDLSSYAPLASPALTGTPTAPTAAISTNTTQVATTAFVMSESANVQAFLTAQVFVLADLIDQKPWSTYVSNWDALPTFNTSIPVGDVYNYLWNGVTRYRLVPSTYTANDDAFYLNFDGTTLSNLIVRRGT